MTKNIIEVKSKTKSIPSNYLFLNKDTDKKSLKLSKLKPPTSNGKIKDK